MPETSLPRGNAARDIGIFPLKRLGRFLIEAEVAQEFALEIRPRSEYAPVNDVALQFTEPTLDLIQP